MDDRYCARHFRRHNQPADPRETARASRHRLNPSFRHVPEFSRLLVGLAAWLLLCCCTPSVAQTVPLYGSTVARFATAEESRRGLGTRDAFVAALSEYDRAARTGKRGPVSEAEFLS